MIGLVMKISGWTWNLSRLRVPHALNVMEVSIFGVWAGSIKIQVMNILWKTTNEKETKVPGNIIVVEETHVIQNCSQFKNTICSFCPKGEVWSEIQFQCVRCGRCSSNHQVSSVKSSGIIVAGSSCYKSQISGDLKFAIFKTYKLKNWIHLSQSLLECVMLIYTLAACFS